MDGSMNIKDKLISFYSDINRTAYADLNVNDKIIFKDKVLAFLTSSNFQVAEDTAMELKRHIFYLHGKQNVFEGALKDLYDVENRMNEEWQRLHYVHQANVFLLGLYLYDVSPQIRRSVDREMKRTSRNFLLDANPTGEFLFRWRMASIVHDLGYAISLSQKGGHFSDDLSTFTHIPGRNFTDIEDIYNFEGKDLLKQVKDRIFTRMRFSIAPLVNYLNENNPFSNSPPFYDHGILSAVIFLHLINDLYSKHNEDDPQKLVAGRELVWDIDFLDGVFPEIAMAVAIHNLDTDKYGAGLLNLEKYYSMKSRPFAWLLKVADMLQEWDKPKTDVAQEDRALDSNLTYNITFEDSCFVGVGTSGRKIEAKIVVNDFPCKRGEKSGEQKILEEFRSYPIRITVARLKYHD